MSYPRGSGVPHRGPAAIWADVIDTGCPNCGSLAGEYCRLEVNGKTYSRHSPCLSRLKAAERQAS